MLSLIIFWNRFNLAYLIFFAACLNILQNDFSRACTLNSPSRIHWLPTLVDICSWVRSACMIRYALIQGSLDRIIINHIIMITVLNSIHPPPKQQNKQSLINTFLQKRSTVPTAQTWPLPISKSTSTKGVMWFYERPWWAGIWKLKLKLYVYVRW